MQFSLIKVSKVSDSDLYSEVASLTASGTTAAGLNDFTFHDLRHCAINKLRLSGNDHYLIKQISGHKTDIAFQRYNLVTEEEIHRIKWLDKKEDNSGTMDTYMVRLVST